MAAEGLVAGRDVAGADGLVAAAPESESASLVVIVAGSGGWETPMRASWANAGATVSRQPTPAQTTATARTSANSVTLWTRFAILMAIFLPSSGFLSPDVWTVPNRGRLGIASRSEEHTSELQSL